MLFSVKSHHIKISSPKAQAYICFTQANIFMNCVIYLLKLNGMIHLFGKENFFILQAFTSILDKKKS